MTRIFSNSSYMYMYMYMYVTHILHIYCQISDFQTGEKWFKIAERTVSVLQEVGKVEELGNQLFDVVRVRHEQTPHPSDRVELAVGHVETENEARHKTVTLQ